MGLPSFLPSNVTPRRSARQEVPLKLSTCRTVDQSMLLMMLMMLLMMMMLTLLLRIDDATSGCRLPLPLLMSRKR